MRQIGAVHNGRVEDERQGKKRIDKTCDCRHSCISHFRGRTAFCASNANETKTKSPSEYPNVHVGPKDRQTHRGTTRSFRLD